MRFRVVAENVAETPMVPARARNMRNHLGLEIERADFSTATFPLENPADRFPPQLPPVSFDYSEHQSVFSETGSRSNTSSILFGELPVSWADI
jgi:hypothetical protein